MSYKSTFLFDAFIAFTLPTLHLCFAVALIVVLNQALSYAFECIHWRYSQGEVLDETSRSCSTTPMQPSSTQIATPENQFAEAEAATNQQAVMASAPGDFPNLPGLITHRFLHTPRNSILRTMELFAAAAQMFGLHRLNDCSL
ncbi:hypothetical protein BKA67DRAFT_571492 [Truncatella angustata]|uniref:Uncharacterized protein n=1 Tax=Truncatella angustata TaxID=152316 RepID=A0A9P8ZW67_9PEZI|nr:uncharacterized protein BKA67DRAFT_571492 [Truncatella angustata]KAH6651648.1 hypothetical protein BKA67DRAFT_571492 [Truncatella angustata]